jgi:hypothetical protein
VVTSIACGARPVPDPPAPNGAAEPAPEAASAVDPDQACGTDDDCVFSAVWRAIESVEDCHWSCCSGAVMNRTAADRFQAGFRRWCAGQSEELQAPCASATCEMRGEPRCMDGRCAEMQPDDSSAEVLPLAPADGPEDPAGSAKVAVYVGVDGICFSTDGSPCGKYPEYAARETVVRVPAEDIERAIADLRTAGFFEDHDRAPGVIAGLPPESFLILVQSADAVHEVLFFYQAGLQVPASYLSALGPLADATDSPTMAKFLSMNVPLDQ